jgi:AraC-like DNA-binding protein
MMNPQPTISYRNVIHVPAGTRQRFVQLEQEAAVPLTKVGVRLSGIGTFGRDYHVGYKDPTCHLLLLTLDGTGYYHSHHHRFRPIQGDLLISPVGVPLLLGTVKRPWTFLWFYINGLRRWHHMDRTPPRLSRPEFALQLHHALEGLLAETGYAGTQSVLTESGWVGSDPKPIKRSSRPAVLFGELISEYLQAILAPDRETEDPWERALQQIWKAIEQSPGRDWSQHAISKQLGVSPATLQRLVRKLFDSTPQKMVVAIRMHQARRLLQQSDYPLSVIANEVGYADAFVLSAAFKRFHGHSPSHFRNDEIQVDFESRP